MLENYIASCGGINNISRILHSDEQLIFEVDQLSLVVDDAKINTNAAMSQVSFRPAHTVDLYKLLSVGSSIKNRQLNAIQSLEKPVECHYRPSWHIAPPSGLLNDPNGFIYHNGEYHLFYQWSPFQCQHVDKYWAHLTSKDMVHWQARPIALTPSDWFDSHGVFSGHAVSNEQQLMLFYTGNVRIGEERQRQTTQCLAVSDNGIDFNKIGPVIDSLPEGVTPHCRDPKVVKIGDEWWMLLGVQRQDLTGRLAVYKSKDLYNWQFDQLYGDELGDFGYMWECPDLFLLDGNLLAVIGPQGITSTSQHHTTPHHNGYLKATISEQGHLSMSDFEQLDHGFDFYAPQTLQTEDGRRVLTAWMGLPDEVNHPTVDNGWIHQLTCLRELSLNDGHLYQQPVSELTSLRKPLEEFTLDNSTMSLATRSFELKVQLHWGDTLSLFKDDNNQVTIALNKENRTLYLDRSKTQIRQGDTIRELALQSEVVDLHILSDNSSLEIFINQGEFVMSSRIFVPNTATGIALKGKAQCQFWPLSPASGSGND
ncbi:putative sucrose-6-phosphate hydrolase [Vibrio sp. MACH09]|uniref:glycoside hydrolase family 32 protein n=1 Tax=Vibrio sp. MACH09 TaxID=3025122 RepID=UPI0027941BD9|nr:glycoside hydrolase family 32 protein [Vibrio sp. MACH09]GLO62624.1 putative sucrose-6-phosphate hydrolase [Vibrio sp. MACH09]